MRAYHIRRAGKPGLKATTKAAPRLSAIAASLAFSGVVAALISLALRSLT